MLGKGHYQQCIGIGIGILWERRKPRSRQQ